MSTDPLKDCADALAEFYLAAEGDSTLISLPLAAKLGDLLSTTESLIKECRRALDEGDWA